MNDRIMIPWILSAVLLIGIGLLGLWYGLTQYSRCKASRNWTKVRGQVNRVGVAKELADTRKNSMSFYVYRPYMDYVYTVAGQDYYCSRRRFGEDEWAIFSRAFASKKRAQASLAGYFEAKLIDVYYNPENPVEAVLEPGNAAAVVPKLLAGLFSCAFGVVMLVIVILLKNRGWLV